MKSNILFIIPSLSAGGGEKSLVNLLSQIDYTLYNVDLFMLNHNGIFMNYLPKEVNIIDLPRTYKEFTLPIHKSVLKFLKSGNFSLAINRILFTITNRVYKSTAIKEQYSWNYLADAIENLDKNYDVAIGFLEKTATYLCVDRVNAVKKVGWVHIDYDKLGMDPNFDIPYFRKLDNIVTVSEECSKILKRRFPSEKEKISVIYNVVSPRMIKEMSEELNNDKVFSKEESVNILSIGRLHHQKGFDKAVLACKILVEKGYNIKWEVIGEGEEREKLIGLIKANNLEENFLLLGLKSNPYPYLKFADIYAQTSTFEGKSIAIDEAKILQKPIVVTNFQTAKDQIQNGINGLIVDMSVEKIAEGIEKLILDNELKNTLKENLSKEHLGTELEVDKLYQILGK